MKKICVIPAYNEAKNIGKVVTSLKRLVDEVVVVDDHSRDNTALLAAQSGASVIRHRINRGQGAALQTGDEYALNAGADIIIHFDGDGQFLAEDIPAMISPLEQGQADIVFGSRFLSKRSNLPRLKRWLIMPLGRIVNYFFGVTTSDPQNGFRAMSRRAAMAIEISNRGMAHCSEILYKSFKNKLRIKEVPITVIYDEFGQGFSGGLRIVKDLILQKLLN